MCISAQDKVEGQGVWQDKVEHKRVTARTDATRNVRRLPTRTSALSMHASAFFYTHN
jgi:hypothetical protein